MSIMDAPTILLAVGGNRIYGQAAYYPPHADWSVYILHPHAGPIIRNVNDYDAALALLRYQCPNCHLIAGHNLTHRLA